LIKELFHLQTKKVASLDKLKEKLGWSLDKIQHYGRMISKRGLAKMSDGLPILTEIGVVQANKLIRAHRLWESYLVSDLGLTEEQIHDDAERYEHLLTEDIINEVDAHLGFPARDPHGAPIPESEQRSVEILSSQQEDSETYISPRQLNTEVINQLWQLGLTPGEKIRILKKTEDALSLFSSEHQNITISLDLARQIYTQDHLDKSGVI
jgi:Mn-dependent DtxR family transcriptional regulator